MELALGWYWELVWCRRKCGVGAGVGAGEWSRG